MNLCMKVGTIIFVLQLWLFLTSKQNENSKSKRKEGKKKKHKPKLLLEKNKGTDPTDSFSTAGKVHQLFLLV